MSDIERSADWTQKGRYMAYAPGGVFISQHNRQEEAEQANLKHCLKNKLDGKYRIKRPDLEMSLTIFGGSGIGGETEPPVVTPTYSHLAVEEQRNESGVLTGVYAPNPSGVLVGYDPAVNPGVTGWSQTDTWEVDQSTVPAGATVTTNIAGRVSAEKGTAASGTYVLTALMNLSGVAATKPFSVIFA